MNDRSTVLTPCQSFAYFSYILLINDDAVSQNQIQEQKLSLLKFAPSVAELRASLNFYQIAGHHHQVLSLDELVLFKCLRHDANMRVLHVAFIGGRGA